MGGDFLCLADLALAGDSRALGEGWRDSTEADATRSR